MCQSWEFVCGHTTESHCQDYKNRILLPAAKNNSNGTASTNINDDDDDPFIDTNSRLTQTRLPRPRSDSTPTPNRPPQFLLPSPTISPSNNSSSDETSLPSSAPGNIRRQSSISSTHARIPLATQQLPLAMISSCRGPSTNKNKSNDQCYDCILRHAKMNSSFQQDEREAEVRLYNEIQGGGQQQAGYGRGGGDRRNGNRGGGEAASYFRAGGAHRQQQQAYNGFPHQAQNQNRFFDYADFHGPGPPGVGMPPPPPPPQMFDGMGMNMNAPALAQFAQNSYQFPLEPFAGQYGASVYAPHPQMDMGYQPGGEGGARFEEFAYQQQQMQGQGQNGNGMPPQGWAGSGYFGTGGW